MKTFEEILAFAVNVEGQGIIDHSNCTYTSEELKPFIRRVMELKKGSRVVEIGLFAGRAASVFFQLHPDLDLDIHLIDNWSWHAAMAAPSFTQLALSLNEVPWTFYKMWSSVLGEKWNLPIHFLHIDGWHDLPGIEPDCRLWLPWVVRGGVAAFHDSDWIDVANCIDKYCKSQGWELLDTAGRTTIWRKPSASIADP